MKTLLVVFAMFISMVSFSQITLVCKISFVNKDTKEVKKTVSSYIINDDYFEVKLDSYNDKETNSTYWCGNVENSFEEVPNTNLYKGVSIKVSDNTKEGKRFNKPVDFLNFMSSIGYKMSTQKVSSSGFSILYLFVKK